MSKGNILLKPYGNIGNKEHVGMKSKQKMYCFSKRAVLFQTVERHSVNKKAKESIQLIYLYINTFFQFCYLIPNEFQGR